MKISKKKIIGVMALASLFSVGPVSTIKAFALTNPVSAVASVSSSDTTAPTLTITPSTTVPTHDAVTLTISAYDSQSGVPYIITQEGNMISGPTNYVTVMQNGTYTFTAVDGAGNKTTKSITVSNISPRYADDKTPPTLTVTASTTAPTTGYVTLTARAYDSQSGVSSMGLPNATNISGSYATYVVTKNGTYYFMAADRAGNYTIQTITVSNIR